MTHGLEDWGSCEEEPGVGWPRPQGRAADLTAHCTKVWGTQCWVPNVAASPPGP